MDSNLFSSAHDKIMINSIENLRNRMYAACNDVVKTTITRQSIFTNKYVQFSIPLAVIFLALFTARPSLVMVKDAKTGEIKGYNWTRLLVISLISYAVVMLAYIYFSRRNMSETEFIKLK